MPTQVHPHDIGKHPDLRILALDQLVEHEYNDAQRTAPLAQRLQSEGLLKNPPIVSRIGDGDARFVVLDGANRTMALSSLGYEYTMVQVVKYEEPYVTLTTWHHLIEDMDPDELTELLAGVEGVDFFSVDYLRARAGLARRECLIYMVRVDGKVFVARPKIPGLSVTEQNHLLNALVDTYKDRGRLRRAMTDSVDEGKKLYPDLSGLVVFPNYDTSEVMALARDGELLPTGLTRHLINGRVLRVNYPLEEFKSGEPLAVKNERLQEWLKMKFKSREVRFYGEMTYLFDE